MTTQHQTRPPSRRLHTAGHLVRQAGRLLCGLLAFAVLLALVVGLPWALIRYVGWPLPHHIPTWDDVQATLLNPMSPQFLLDVLACLCWIVWFLFTLDVLRCTVDALHGVTWPQVRPAGPLHGLAAALIGTVALTVLGNRTPTSPPTTSLGLTSDLNPVAVTAPVHPGLAQPASTVPQTTLTIDPAAPAPPGTVQVTEEVRPPQNRIYDSLWRIAERVYHDGARWPELFQLNRGIVQPDGRALTNPNLLRPGWKIIAYIPESASPADHPPRDHQPPVPPTQPPPTPTAPTTPPTMTPAAPSSHPPADTHHTSERGHGATAAGLDLVTGAFVSLSMAAVVTAALTSVRMWRRRRYRIGSGDRSDLQRPIAPVVRALRLTHDRDDGQTWEHDVDVIDPAPKPATRIHDAIAVQTPVGVRDCRELALNLAGMRGLGLLGPGATAAARALLLHLLAEHSGAIRILVPATDLDLLFDGAHVESLPSTVGVVDSLDAALDEMETALLTRTRHTIDQTDPRPAPAPLVLLASPAPHTDRRLQAVLDNGSTLGLAGILLGQWRPGATLRVRPDGTVSATSPGLGDALTDARLFILPAADATELLAVLREAEGPTDLTPTDPGTGTVKHNEGIPLGDDTPNDQGITQPPQAPKQQTIEKLTQLESTSPPDSGAGNQGEPFSPLQLLDIRTAPANIQPHTETPTAITDTHRHTVATNAVSAYIEPVDGPPRHSPQPPEDEKAEEPEPRQPLTLRVLGRVELVLHHEDRERDLTAALTPKQREVLVYLALHPHGARREALNDAVWPDARPPRPFNSLHNAMSLLRRALHNATNGAINNLILNDDGRYHLNTDRVTTDHGQVLDHLHTPCSTSGDGHALAPLREAAQLYRGDLAEDLTAVWIEPFRESIRRDILDALGALIRNHSDNDPKTTLKLLERTRQLDRYNESVYRDIIRTQARLGQHEAIPRTLTLLTTTLDEIDQQPGPETLNLADFLQRRNNTRRPTSPEDAAAS